MRRPQERGAQVGRRLDADDRGIGRERDLGVGRDDRDARAAVERSGRDRGAHPPRRAIADEPDRVDRLARPAGGHDDVAPGEVRVAGGPRQRWTRGRIRGTDRAIADGRDDGIHDGLEVGQPPDSGLAGRERPGARFDDPVAERAQSRHIRDGRRVRPHVAVHRRGDHHRRRRRETGRGHDVA